MERKSMPNLMHFVGTKWPFENQTDLRKFATLHLFLCVKFNFDYFDLLEFCRKSLLKADRKAITRADFDEVMRSVDELVLEVK